MPTFLLITDIDKNASSWYKWRPYDSDKIYETDFVDQLKTQYSRQMTKIEG